VFFISEVRMSSITFTDPTSAPPPGGAFDRFFLKLIRDPRDLPFARVQVMNLVVLLALTIWLYADFRWYNALLFVAWYGFQLGPYTLMLHNVCHRKYFRAEYSWLDWPLIALLGMPFGHMPNAYFAHHVGMHHPENNLDDDLSSTMHLQRDSAWDFFYHYLGRFLVLGGHDLSGYLEDRDRTKIRRQWRLGILTWFVVVVGLALVNWQATLLVFGFTLIVTRTAMMSGNWAQHAFVDATRPDNCYVNSITCINSSYNRRCFNDGYHISHHWKPTRHWTEHPQELQDHLAEYAAADAIVFRKLDFFMVWVYLMLKRYDKLADCYVPLDDRQRSKEEIIALLKERTRRIPEAKLAAAPA
jgi:hypothetical protein